MPNPHTFTGDPFFFHFSPQKEELFRNMQKERDHHYGNHALSTYKHKTLRR